jgi:hypothetical protein
MAMIASLESAIPGKRKAREVGKERKYMNGFQMDGALANDANITSTLLSRPSSARGHARLYLFI